MRLNKDKPAHFKDFGDLNRNDPGHGEMFKTSA